MPHRESTWTRQLSWSWALGFGLGWEHFVKWSIYKQKQACNRTVCRMVSADMTTRDRNNWALSIGAMVQCWLLQCYPLGRATITNEEHPLKVHLAFVWMWYFIFLKSFLDVHGKSEGAVGPLAHSITSVLLWLCPGRLFSTKCNSISAAGCQELMPTVKGKILHCSSTAAVLGRTSFSPKFNVF